MSKPNNAPAKQGSKSSSTSKNNAWFAPAAIVICLIVAEAVFHVVMGNPSNFEGGDPVKGHPIHGNALGTIYKGGFIVPILMTMFLLYHNSRCR